MKFQQLYTRRTGQVRAAIYVARNPNQRIIFVSDQHIIELTADIVAAHVSNNDVATQDLPELIRSVYAALLGTTTPAVEAEPAPEPAVSVRASVKPDYIVCLEDGAKLKMLKRYLRTHFDMSPDDYRQKWNLPRDYPMVAPNYAEQRRSLAHQIGLGRKRDEDGAEAPAPKRAARKAKDAAGA
jgi:predicted transcriptional regulator